MLSGGLLYEHFIATGYSPLKDFTAGQIFDADLLIQDTITQGFAGHADSESALAGLTASGDNGDSVSSLYDLLSS